MIHKHRALLLFALLVIVTGPALGAKPRPSFDCRKAESDIEKQICLVPEYARLDREIASLFARALKSLPAADAARLKTSQVKWLGKRNDCIDLIHGDPPVFAEVNSCLGDALKQRAKELEVVVETGKVSEAPAPE